MWNSPRSFNFKNKTSEYDLNNPRLSLFSAGHSYHVISKNLNILKFFSKINFIYLILGKYLVPERTEGQSTGFFPRFIITNPESVKIKLGKY